MDKKAEELKSKKGSNKKRKANDVETPVTGEKKQKKLGNKKQLETAHAQETTIGTECFLNICKQIWR